MCVVCCAGSEGVFLWVILRPWVVNWRVRSVEQRAGLTTLNEDLRVAF